MWDWQCLKWDLLISFLIVVFFPVLLKISLSLLKSLDLQWVNKVGPKLKWYGSLVGVPCMRFDLAFLDHKAWSKRERERETHFCFRELHYKKKWIFSSSIIELFKLKTCWVLHHHLPRSEVSCPQVMYIVSCKGKVPLKWEIHHIHAKKPAQAEVVDWCLDFIFVTK